MSMMQTSLNTFSARLLEISGTLEEQKEAVGKAEEAVFSVLHKAAADIAPHTTQDAQDEENLVRKTISQVFSELKEHILRWQADMQKRSEVRKKLEEMGSGLIVAVFGCTNAGKSTLGNFLRGRQLRAAPFDNAWKHKDFPVGPIKIVEKDSGSTVESNAPWFEEGSTETTREAQIFQLPGLLWLDTPGFGSMNDKTLGELARKYVKRADLVVYLDDSGNPGLANITQNLLQLLKEGRRTLIAINQSDLNERVKTADGKIARDENGKIMQRRVPKTEETRRKQEEYLIGTLVKELPSLKVKAISISMLLAKMAVEGNDDELYRGSNIDALFAQILDLIPDNSGVARIKYDEALQNCIALIDGVLGTEASGQGLKKLEADCADLEERIRQTESTFDVENETRAIVRPPLLKARNSLDKLVRSVERAQLEKEEKAKNTAGGWIAFPWRRNDTPQETPQQIDINPILEATAKAALQELEKRTQHLLKDLWQQTRSDMLRAFPVMAAVELERRHEKHVYEVTESESYRRDPDGVIENFCSWLGKEYYGRRLVTRKKEQTIDLGFNTREVLAEAYQKMEACITEYIRQEMEMLRRECLVRGADVVRERRKVLAGAAKELENQRHKLESRLSAANARP